MTNACTVQLIDVEDVLRAFATRREMDFLGIRFICTAPPILYSFGGTLVELENFVNEQNRKLVAVMFTDIVGYSRLMSTNERHALALLDSHDLILAKVIETYSGRVIKRMGDAFFAEFDAAIKAVRCGIEIQRALARYNGEATAEDQISVRIGIHLGDVVVRNDDLFGDGINIAARLEPLAKPGGICISNSVYQSIKGNADVEPVLVGEVVLKNITERHVIYEFPPFYQTTRADPLVIEPLQTLKPKGMDFVFVRTDILSKHDWVRHFVVTFAAVLLSAVAGVTVALFGRPTNAYQITMEDVVDSISLAQELSQSQEGLKKDIWRTFSTGSRQEIAKILSEPHSEQTRIALAQELRVGLNNAVDGNRPLDAPEGAMAENLKEANRRTIEKLFPEGIAVASGNRDSLQILYANFSNMNARTATVLTLIFTILLSGALISSWLTRPNAYRFVFDDLHSVDNLFEYLVESMGFRKTTSDNEFLRFQANFTTLLMWGVWSITARIDGNSVLVHGPTNFLNRLNKTLAELSRQAPN